MSVSEESTATPRLPNRRSILAKLFVSPSEPRLRAGWRLLLQTALMWVLLIVSSIGLTALVPRLLRGSPADFGAPEVFAAQIAELIAITLSVFVARRILDRRSFVSLGLRLDHWALLDFGVGLGITFLMLGLIFASERLLGWLQISGLAWETESAGRVILNLLAFLAICLLVGWNEELMSRGYHLQTLASGMNLTWGWILSSAVFGMLHLANPHATWTAVAGIVLAGLFFGFAWLRTGQLWLSIGLHTGWNFFEGVVFGFPVSGLPFYHLTQITVQGPVRWTGGEFGPEAGLILLPALALGFGLVHAYAGQHQRLA